MRAATTVRLLRARDGTPAHPVAIWSASGDALGVASERFTCAEWLGTCPACRSDAIREVRVEPVDRPLVHCLVQCGQCEACRSLFDTGRAVRRVERHLRRKRRRDRRQIAREARAAARTWRTGSALEVWLVGLAAERAVVVSDDAGNTSAGDRRD